MTEVKDKSDIKMEKPFNIEADGKNGRNLRTDGEEAG